MNNEHENLTDDQREQIKHLLMALEEKVEQDGWDQPCKLWVLTDEDGTVKLHENTLLDAPPFLGQHPGESMEVLYNMGARLVPSAIGVVLNMEGWRHRHLSEVESDPVDQADRDLVRRLEVLRDIMRKDGTPDEEIERILSRRYWKTVIDLRPSQMRPDMRREFRTLIVVIQSGESNVVSRTRGGDQEKFGTWQAKENTLAGRVPAAMFQLLSWQDAEYVDAHEVINRNIEKG